MGLYKPNGVPWEGKSAVVPMKAVEDMRKLNHNWNWIPLEDIERTCRMEPYSPSPQLAEIEEGFKCSECLATFGPKYSVTFPYPYCPNCGAKVVD